MLSQDGDSFFRGLDMTRDPAVVQEGYYTVGEHVECNNGTVASRPGNLSIPWADTWDIISDGQVGGYEKRPIEAHGTLIDAVLFRNVSSGLENVVFVTSEGGYVIQPGSRCETIAWPTGFTAPSEGMLVQAYNKLYFLNNTQSLEWSGDHADDWEVIADPSGYTSLGAIQTDVGLYHKNRLFITTDSNTVWASDILVPNAFNINNEFYINQGDSDSIVRLLGYTNDRVVVFKDNSMYSIDNLTGDISGAEINLIAQDVGLSAKRCVSLIGQEIFWLSRRGIMRAALAYDQRLTPDMVPLSEPIEDVIRRINWGSADGAWSETSGDRIYFAVPVDDATVNNCVLVYNLKSEAWESVDIYDDFTEGWEYTAANSYTDNWGPQAMVRMTYAGRDVVVSFTHLGSAYLMRYNRGKQDIHIEPQAALLTWDQAADSQPPVSPTGTWDATLAYHPFIQNPLDVGTQIQTRGYLAKDASTKRGTHIDINTSTYNPNFSLSLVNGGPNETTAIKANVTRSNTKRLDYQNSATVSIPQTHTEAYLEDYSIDLGTEATTAEHFYFGDNTYSDVYLPREQEFNERFRINKRTRAPRIKVTNTDGLFRLKSVVVTEHLRNKKHRREV